MSRPEPAEYNLAIQNPRTCFADPELRGGQSETDALGLPRAASGNFASVYRMHCGGRDWAVRCFLRDVGDQEHRYRAIGAHLSAANLPYTVDFDFLPRGILVRGRWHPILKMEWVRGDPLSVYIQKHLRDRAALGALADGWLEMMRALHRAGIAHGDLQPGNVLVIDGRIRLIDYDGMFVPALAGRRSHELGHRDFQPPDRRETHFGSYLDNFSACLIYLSLLAFRAQPDLGAHIRADSEHLLFRREDLERPDGSAVFAALARLPDPEIRALAPQLRSFLAKDMSLVPALHRLAAGPAGGNGRTKPSGRPGWLDDHAGPPPGAPASPAPAAGNGGMPAWVLDHLRAPSAARSRDSPLLGRLLWMLAMVIASLLLPLLSGAYGALPAGALAIGAVAVIGLVLAAGILHLPEVRGKVRAWIALQRTARAVGRGEREVRRLSRARYRVHRRAHDRLKSLKTRREECGRREAAEVARIDGELQTVLDALRTQEKELWRKHRRAIERALLEHQERFVAGQLARTFLVTSRTPGLGPRAKVLLMAYGVISAGDLAAVRLEPAVHGASGGTVVSLDLSGRGSIRADGLGPAEARALRDWRRSAEDSARAALPRGLPPGQMDRISEGFRRKRTVIERGRADAAARTSRRREASARSCGRQRDRLTRRENEIRRELTAWDHRGLAALSAAEHALARRRRELDAARDNFAAQGAVTIRQGVRRP